MTARKLIAFNTAKFSDNKIHDDAVASKLGFTGGLVPGVEVYGYMAHPAIAKWGADFFDGGQLSGTFLKPVFDGEETTVSEEGGAITVSTANNALCATGTMGRSDRTALTIPSAPRPAPCTRPDASPDSLPEGKVLGSLRETFVREECRWYLDAISEDLDFFHDRGPAHPGFMLRRANFVLAFSVKLGPWIHIASDMVFHSVLRDGEEFETRGIVTRNYEKNGHRIVDLDVLMLVGDRPVMSGQHSAIYRPRQLA